MNALKLSLHFTERGWTASDPKGKDRTKEVLFMIDKLEERWKQRLRLKSSTIVNLQNQLGLAKAKLEEDTVE